MNPGLCDSKALALHHCMAAPLLESQQAYHSFIYSAPSQTGPWALSLTNSSAKQTKQNGQNRGGGAHKSARWVVGLPRGSDAELRPEGEADGPWNSPSCGAEDLYRKRTRMPTLLLLTRPPLTRPGAQGPLWAGPTWRMGLCPCGG